MGKYVVTCPQCGSNAILLTLWRFAKSKCPSCGMKTYGMIRLTDENEVMGERECEAVPVGIRQQGNE